MAKLGKYIFISFFLVFVMSHNAFAVDTTIDITNYNVVRSAQVLNINCKFNDGALDVTNAGICGGVSTNQLTVNLQRLYSNNSYSFKTGDIIEYDIAVYTETGVNSDNGFTVRNGAMPEYPFRVLSVKQNSSVDSNRLYHSTNTGFYGEHHYFYSIYHYELIYVGADDASYQLGWRSGYGNLFEYTFGGYYFRLENFVQYRSSGESQINKEQKKAAEDAAADSQTSGSSSQNDATSATSSLISVITSGIGAITSASASNCVINADMGNLDMGSIDLCANPVPTFMQVIGSIIAALVVLPLVIVLFNRFIAIIGSFQR